MNMQLLTMLVGTGVRSGALWLAGHGIQNFMSVGDHDALVNAIVTAAMIVWSAFDKYRHVQQLQQLTPQKPF